MQTGEAARIIGLRNVLRAVESKQTHGVETPEGAREGRLRW